MKNLETSSQTCEIKQNLETPEIADTFNWSREEREKLNEEILVEKLRQKLIEKYPEQKCFFESAIIKLMQLGKNIDEHKKILNEITWTNIYSIRISNWELSAYVDDLWRTIFDIKWYDIDNFWNILSKKLFTDRQYTEKRLKNWEKVWSWFYYDRDKNWNLFIVISEYFKEIERIWIKDPRFNEYTVNSLIFILWLMKIFWD